MLLSLDHSTTLVSLLRQNEDLFCQNCKNREAWEKNYDSYKKKVCISETNLKAVRVMVHNEPLLI